MHHTKPATVDGTVPIGLTSKIHALVDTNGLPVRLALTAGEAHVAFVQLASIRLWLRVNESAS